MLPKKLGPRNIVGYLRGGYVREPIDFDDELHLQANKIGEVGSYRMLAAEMEAMHLIAAQRLPEFVLGECLRAAELPSKALRYKFSLTMAFIRRQSSCAWAEAIAHAANVTANLSYLFAGVVAKFRGL